MFFPQKNTGIYKDIEEGGLWFLYRKFTNEPRFIHIEATSCHTHYKGWLGYWKQKVGWNAQDFLACSFEGCESKAILGAHVRWSGSNPKYASWYIAPSCSRCNRQHSLAGKLKNTVKLVKVIDGRVFRKTKILAGNIDHSEADRLIQNLKDREKGEYEKTLVDTHNKWITPERDERKKKQMVRQWPLKRNLGFIKFGWKVKNIFTQ